MGRWHGIDRTEDDHHYRFLSGSILVLAEAVALHRKLSRYRAHLRGLYQTKSFFRLFAEICSIAFVVLI
jgi:hypothetical protein